MKGHHSKRMFNVFLEVMSGWVRVRAGGRLGASVPGDWRLSCGMMNEGQKFELTRHMTPDLLNTMVKAVCQHRQSPKQPQALSFTPHSHSNEKKIPRRSWTNGIVSDKLLPVRFAAILLRILNTWENKSQQKTPQTVPPPTKKRGGGKLPDWSVRRMSRSSQKYQQPVHSNETSGL